MQTVKIKKKNSAACKNRLYWEIDVSTARLMNWV